jgi:hypothetical protein
MVIGVRYSVISADGDGTASIGKRSFIIGK